MHGVQEQFGRAAAARLAQALALFSTGRVSGGFPKNYVVGP